MEPFAPKKPLPEPPPPPQSYRLAKSRARRLELAALMLALLGFVTAAASARLWADRAARPSDALLAVAPAMLLFVAALSMLRASRDFKLTLSEDGIVYRGYLSTLTAGWSDVGGTTDGGRGIDRGMSLVLSTPARLSAPRLVRRTGLAPSPMLIPLEAFADPFEGSALQLDVRRRAAWVLGDGERPVPSTHSPAHL